MLDTVLFARDKWLASDGSGKTGCVCYRFNKSVIFCKFYKTYLFTVYPDKCTMSVVGVEDKKRMEEKVTFWEDVYGI